MFNSTFLGRNLKLFFFFNKFKTGVLAFARVINLATTINLLTHYAKGTLLFYPFIRLKTSTAYRVTISNFPSQYFTLSLDL